MATKTKKKPKKRIVVEGGKTPEGLNLLNEAFCQAYVNGLSETFGNGVQSYLEVYGPDHFIKYKKPLTYKVAQVLAFDLLRVPKIIARINSLLEEGGFNDQNVDKQHLFLINQHADLKTKLGAIKEYNALKVRIKNKLEVTLPTPILDVLNNNRDKESSESEQED